MDMYHLKQIPSETQIRKFLRRVLFGKNVFCPACRSREVLAYEDRYRCQRCRVKFSLTSHTWLSGIRLPLQTTWLILWSWTRQVPVKQAADLTERSRQAIYDWYDLFRLHLPHDPVILEKIVQLDEAFGRGWTLMAAKQQGTRKTAYAFLDVPDPTRLHAVTFAQSHVRPRSRLHTDGAGIYRGIEAWWPVKHQTDIHRKWEFGKTSEIEGFFGNLRTFIRRMYHHVTAEKMPAYVREFVTRFSSPEIFESPRHYLSKTLTLVPPR